MLNKLHRAFSLSAAAGIVALPLLFSSMPTAAASTAVHSSNGPSVTIMAQDDARRVGDPNGFAGDRIDNTPDNALKSLKTQVSQDISKNQYELDGGGFVNGSDVLKSGTNGVQINDAIYAQLSGDGKKAFVSDVVTNTKKYSDPKFPAYDPSLAKSNGVDNKTASNWFKELRSHSGIGSAMLTDILKSGVHADLNTGAQWFQPFSGPLSSFLGFMAILVISMMGIRSIVDLSYISIPIFQSAVDGASGRMGGGGGGTTAGGTGGTSAASSGGGAKIVSTAAKQAVQASEEGKNAIWTYFRKAAMEYIFLGIAILFLCFNYMWDIAGSVMDAGTGLLGY